MLKNFKINPQAVKHGNHVSNVDAQYCTKCELDTAGPIFDFYNDCPHGVDGTCPHIKIEWMEGDLVSTITADGSMGPGRIISIHLHHNKRVAILHYENVDHVGEKPTHRTEWYTDLIPWNPPAATIVEQTIRERFMEAAITDLANNGISGEASRKLLHAIFSGLETIKSTENK